MRLLVSHIVSAAVALLATCGQFASVTGGARAYTHECMVQPIAARQPVSPWHV